MNEVYLARQPIFGQDQNIIAYELFYRSGYTNHYTGSDADEASSRVLLSAFQQFGLEHLTGGKPAFVNFPGNLLKQDVATLFCNRYLVIEILESVQVDEEIRRKCQELKDEGYVIVLDDFSYASDLPLLLDLADIVKIDLQTIEREELAQQLQQISNADVVLLAEKVESWSDFRLACTLGFHLFQGYFFKKPELLSSKALTPLQLNYLRILEELSKPSFEFKRLANIISEDLSFAHSLLQLVNSAYFRTRQPIKSILHALVYLGEQEIRKWVSLLALQKMSVNKPDAIISTSLVRGRLLCSLAEKTEWKKERDELYLAGFFSLLDVLLQRPLELILDELQLSVAVREMLLHETGIYADLWAIVLAYEQGQWDLVEVLALAVGIDVSWLTDAYIQALLAVDLKFG